MNIAITRHASPPAPATGNFGFGQIFTPHMFKMEYAGGQWKNPRIEPYGPLVLDPAAKVLHYGQEIFEGMKAYRNPRDGSVHMFRPDRNIRRFTISCGRMCMPEVDPKLFMEALEQLIDLDRDWVPESPDALYIRPTMIATQFGLGVKASTDYLFYIIIGPVGSYFKGGINPLRLKAEEKYVRSAPGGTGYAKTGGNYSAALLPIKLAETEGFDNIIWLDARERKFVEEMGAMNIAFVYDDRVVTAATGDTILDGVTRDSVSTLVRDFGHNWVEEPPAIARICAVRIPVHLFESITRLLRIQRALTQQLGREPTNEELALEVGYLAPAEVQLVLRAQAESTELDPVVKRHWEYATLKVDRILRSAEEPVSLEGPVGDEDSSQLGDFIEDADALEPMDAAAREMLREQVQHALAALSERERQVLELRFGLIDGKDHTLEEVSRYFNVTRERIRQIEAKALRKLRHPTRSRHLRDYLG